MSNEPTPPCDGECGELLRSFWRDKGMDVTVSAPAFVVVNAYYQGFERCPHGVLWYCEPTTDQQLQWAKDGVE